MDNTKVDLRIVIGGITSGVLIAIISCVILYFNTILSTKITLRDYNKNAGEVICNIEAVEVCNHNTIRNHTNLSTNNLGFIIEGNGNNSKFIDIRGWSIIRGEEITTFKTSVLLKEVGNQTDEFIKLSTEMEKTPYLTQETFAEDGKIYDYAGFLATIPKKKLKSGSVYNVYLHYQNNYHDILVDTGNLLDLDKLEGEE